MPLPCSQNSQTQCDTQSPDLVSDILFSVVVKYHGKASHAASHPWAGINALDAAVLAYNNISVLRQQLKPDWRVHGEALVS